MNIGPNKMTIKIYLDNKFSFVNTNKKHLKIK